MNSMDTTCTTDSINLVQTSGEDLLPLQVWLTNHLPYSWKMSCMLRECLEGRWIGQTWWVLRTKDTILAVGEGLPDETSEIIDYMTKPRSTCFYSPDPVHAEMLLTWPGFIDWSQPCIFEMLSIDNANIVDKICRINGSIDPFPRKLHCTFVVADPGDVELRPVPAGLHLRSLDPVNDPYIVMSTWKHSRKYADDFVRALVKCFPSVGLFDKDDNCVGYELGLQDETVGLLYVMPEARGQGLAKVIISQLAHKYFEIGLPTSAVVISGNEASLKLHQNLGFKVVCELEFVLHVPHDKFNGEFYGF
uniref:Glycine N-acyltransferase-like protein n=1 Tax=Arion vulgaris TaxID=1028688 RepID=A0A0B6ZAY4_9EUPU